MKSVEITASSYDEALAKALEELGLTLKQVDVTSVKESGIIRKKTTIVVEARPSAEELAFNFVNGIIEKMQLNVEATLKESDDAIEIDLSGEDTSKLIGYRGDVLDSLQYLALLVAGKNNPKGKRMVIDGENYREKRTVTLTKLAKRLAFKAAKSGEIISLEPMNPFERRIIHSALAEDKYVTTSSEGEEPNRYVTIVPNKTKRNNERSDRRDRREKREKKSYDDYDVEIPVPEQKEEQEKDMYNTEYSRNFKKKGAGKIKSYGAPKSKYF
ncbi:MAG: RNA-binding cell elongation regulator Jag/EloR [Christensenellales bacterium]